MSHRLGSQGKPCVAQVTVQKHKVTSKEKTNCAVSPIKDKASRASCAQETPLYFLSSIINLL